MHHRAYPFSSHLVCHVVCRNNISVLTQIYVFLTLFLTLCMSDIKTQICRTSPPQQSIIASPSPPPFPTSLQPLCTMTVASSTAAAHSRVKHGTSYADILSGVFNHRAGANPDKAPFASAGTIVAREGGVPKCFDQGADPVEAPTVTRKGKAPTCFDQGANAVVPKYFDQGADVVPKYFDQGADAVEAPIVTREEGVPTYFDQGANAVEAPIVAHEGGVPKYFDQGADADSGLDAMVSTVKTIFSKVLNVDIALIGLSSDFFELGGSSLDTIALICRIEQDVNIQGKRVVFIQVSRSSCHQNLTSLMPQLLYAFKFRKMSSFLTRP